MQKKLFNLSFILMVVGLAFNQVNAGVSEAKTRGMVFLVPGTLNSLVPGDFQAEQAAQLNSLGNDKPYYSDTIVQSVAALGYVVKVVRDLYPTGDLDINSTITEDYIRAEYLSAFPKKDVPIILIGHSAGGLYALKAADRLSSLPIRQIALVATPLKGSFVSETVFSNSEFRKNLINQIQQVSRGYFDLRGIPQLTSEGVESFLSTVRLPREVKVYSFCGAQVKPPSWDMWNSKYLSPVLNFTAWFANDMSDGVVEVNSALGEGVVLLNSDNRRVAITAMGQHQARLDHVEQVLDSHYLALLGFHNTEEVRRQQNFFYRKLMTLIAP